MTTIAADAKEGVMCADSFWTDGDECGTTRKVFRIHGNLLGGAGTTQYLNRWWEAYRSGATLPRGGDISILRLSAKGIDYWHAIDYCWESVEQTYFAIGSGGAIARGAMMAGASCARAVRIAVNIDALSGGRVRTYRLRP
jgi:hypothetical protein